jgi:L-fuconolactonase
MALTREDQRAWLDLVQEETLDPDRVIVDPHHHMWRSVGGALPPFLLEDLWADTDSGHHVTQTVFMECGAEYRDDGPEHLKAIGETEFVTAAAKSSRGSGKAVISGIVGHTDLLADPGLIREALDAHIDASDGLFRGIRHGGAHDPDRVMHWGDATPHPDLYERSTFRSAVRLLGELGHSYDTWHYHFQNKAYLELARSAPNTVMVLDHFGSPVGVGPYASRRAEIFTEWKDDIRAIAGCENVVAKIGGLAMPPNGFDWHTRDTPATSDELVAAQRDYYLHAIDCFGPDRCMFESNFPVDKMSLSYHTYWNAMKKIASAFTDEEQDQMFSGTASRVYRL